MKNTIAVFAVLLLSACATNVTLKDTTTGEPKGEGILTIAFISDGKLSIQLDGMEFQGSWSPLECKNEPCIADRKRTPETNYHISHGRHTMLGKSVLVAFNGATLDCDWRKHRDSVEGACTASDGRRFALTGAD